MGYFGDVLELVVQHLQPRKSEKDAVLNPPGFHLDGIFFFSVAQSQNIEKPAEFMLAYLPSPES